MHRCHSQVQAECADLQGNVLTPGVKIHVIDTRNEISGAKNPTSLINIVVNPPLKQKVLRGLTRSRCKTTLTLDTLEGDCAGAKLHHSVQDPDWSAHILHMIGGETGAQPRLFPT